MRYTKFNNNNCTTAVSFLLFFLVFFFHHMISLVWMILKINPIVGCVKRYHFFSRFTHTLKACLSLRFVHITGGSILTVEMLTLKACLSLRFVHITGGSILTVEMLVDYTLFFKVHGLSNCES